MDAWGTLTKSACQKRTGKTAPSSSGTDRSFKGSGGRADSGYATPFPGHKAGPPPQWRTRGGSEAAGRDPPPAASTGKGARVPSGTWDGRHRGRTDGPVVLGIVGMTTTPAPWLLSLLLPPRRAEANGPFLLYHTSLPRCCHIKIVVPFLDLPALDPNLIAYSYEWGVI